MSANSNSDNSASSEEAKGERLRQFSHGRRPPVVYADDEAPEMASAMEEARSRIDQFILALSNPKPAQSSFSVKLQVEEGEEVEHVWICPVRYQDETFVGTICNEPGELSSIRKGDEISVEREKISDWMFVDNGRLVGGFTIRVLRKSLSEEEAYEFDQATSFVIVEDSHADDEVVRFFDAIGNAEYEVLRELLKADSRLADQIGSVAVESLLGEWVEESQHPLKYAVYHGSAAAVEILLQAGCEVDPRDQVEATPLHDAARLGHVEIIALLAKHGADINARNRIGLTPLKTAAGNGHVDCAVALLELGADINIRLESNAQGILHNISNVAMAKTLVEAGAELDVIDYRGDTPLHHAIMNGDPDLAVYLIEQGASTETENEDGETPIDLADEGLDDAGKAAVLNAIGKRCG